MAQPRTYTQTTTFTDHSTVSPDDPHSGANLDVEFVEVKQTLDDLNTNIALLQRDDGKLSNQAVHKDSFDQGHIDGALNLSNNNIDNFVSDTEKNQSIIVCCHHGNSSQRAAQFLTDRGFKNVYSLNGGYEQWKSQENK